MELSHDSMINNYRAFGRREPSPKAAMSGYDMNMSDSHPAATAPEADYLNLMDPSVAGGGGGGGG
eukprot:scaffold7770_cov155-Ochromonas_danica.AAC.1